MSDPQIRRARAEDVPAIIELMVAGAADPTREKGANPAVYDAAFEAIDADPNQTLIVLDLPGEGPIGTIQLTVTQGLSYHGGRRLTLENVYVAPHRRGQGHGGAMIAWAVEEGRRRGCVLVQLTSNRSRPDAHRFYERLGFVASHLGMKYAL